MRSKKFTGIFEDFLKTHREFQEVFEIAKRNSSGYGRRSHGRIWIIGGFVYRPIIKSLYGEIPEPLEIDIDFLIERSPKKRDLYLPDEWGPKITDYGNLYLVKGNTRIDLNYLKNFHSIIARRLQPEFGHFFTGTPMGVQAIAYDLTDKSAGVRGKIGIEALRDRIVRVNNLEEASYEAQNESERQKKVITVGDLVKEKAKELHFGYDITQIDNSRNHNPDAPEVFISPRENIRREIR